MTHTYIKNAHLISSSGSSGPRPLSADHPGQILSSASSPTPTPSTPTVSISILVNEMLVYLRELQSTHRVSLQSPFSRSPRRGSLIRVFSRLRDIVTAGQSSTTEQFRWAANWNDEDSALYCAMVKALERMVATRGSGQVADAHLIALLKTKGPRIARRATGTTTTTLEMF